MDYDNRNNQLDALVRRIFFIEDTTYGTQEQGFVVRYRGRLVSADSESAYDQISESTKSLGLTPLFRKEDGRHAILFVPQPPAPKPFNPKINLIMFILTLFSVLFAGAVYSLREPLPANFFQAALAIFKSGWPFGVSLLAILAAHEFGHYFMARHHGVNVSLPYFIPMPFFSFGTMGAFINMKGMPKNKKHLLEIGLAGPLAGLAVTIPVLLLGLSLSKVEALPTVIDPNMMVQVEGNSILYLFMKYLVFGQLLPAPATYGNVPPVLYWLQYIFTGTPSPLGGMDVMLHPVAWAGWAGLLVTALNLIPAGQLDGGHAMYVLFGKERILKLWPVIMLILVGMGFLWTGWWLWAAMIFFMGRVYAEPLDQITEIDPKRRVLAIFALVLFFLIFIPIPLTLLS